MSLENYDNEFEENDDIINDDSIDDDIDLSDNNDDNDDDISEIESNESDDVILSRHTIEGKHSLKYDTIFKGKKEENISEDDIDSTSMYFNETFEVDKSSNYWNESIDNENYIKNKRVKEKVYDVLYNDTELNFSANRRKPSKNDFNKYFYLLKTKLKDEGFSNIELFNELAVYFSDNLFNMFKLLDNKWRNDIIAELQEHIGKQNYSKEVMNRNIYVGTEIEFEWFDDNTNEFKHITGVIEETYYDDSEYLVNSYEKLYNVHLDKITKILNNSKFKNNLNKLNNIDFL